MQQFTQHGVYNSCGTPADDKCTTFLIVTPVKNCAKYINEAIASVLLQSGDFEIRYHIQDGGSSDGTLDHIENWHRLHVSEHLPVLCRDISFTYSIGSDEGLYDALNKGFEVVQASDECSLMTWIGADDRIASGALSCLSKVNRTFPEIAMFTGRASLLDVDGGVVSIDRPFIYDNYYMSAGLYDGRILPFVMQEGTFWTSKIWREVGGLNKSFKLAGDWDLWRRCALHGEIATIDAVTGFHRVRPGQLSGDLAEYYREIDQFLSTKDEATLGRFAFENADTLHDIYGSVIQERLAMEKSPKLLARRVRTSTRISYDFDKGEWTKIGVTSNEGRISWWEGLDYHGEDVSDLGLLGGYFWATQAQSKIRFDVDVEGHFLLKIKVRNVIENQWLTVICDNEVKAKRLLPQDGLRSATEMYAEIEVRGRSFEIAFLCTRQVQTGADSRTLAFLLEDMELLQRIDERD